MKILRWIIGVVLLGSFLYWNFYKFEYGLIVKFINILLFCALYVLYRVILGPTAADRIVAVDILGVLIIGLLALLGIYYDKQFFIDIGLIWALMSFIASLAFAKILEGRNLDE